MPSALTLQNFESIAARERIKFAPLTLLFGASSVGKSAVSQVLLYAQRPLERGAADVYRAELAGEGRHEGDTAR